MNINGMTPLIQVFDMPSALKFYRDVLGFEVVADSGNGGDSSWVWLRLNGTDLMLNDQFEPGHGRCAPPIERTKCQVTGLTKPPSNATDFPSLAIDRGWAAVYDN